MKSDIRVAAPPSKPLMVFDGDCNFCTLWIRRWQQLTDDAVEYLPSQDASVTARFPEIPCERFATAVQLIEPDGAVYSGAEAVFRTLAKNPKWQWPLRTYENSPALANLTEWAYRLVAENRTFFSLLTRWCWGRHVERPDYVLTRWIFLRALGVIYLFAFVSLWTQISGLIGHNGILPTDQFMSAVQQQCDVRGIGLERFYLLPTLSWFNASDGFLNFQCAAGTALAVLLIVGIAPAPCLALLWLIYLSLATVGRDFLGFQWDNLLLEAGFLAIFFAPLHLVARASRPRVSSASIAQNQKLTGGTPVPQSPPSRILLWLLRLLLFKLMFSSGCVKLLSGDPAWRNLTALTFHYQTQPLPTWLGWYANLLPLAFQKFSCAAMFAIEIGAPFLIFAPRRLRFFGAAALVSLQLLIMLTGNYTFFNFLAIALCLLLLDDFILQRIIPSRLHRPLSPNSQLADSQLSTAQPSTLNRRWPRKLTVPLAIIVASISLFQMISMFGVRSSLLAPAAVLDGMLMPLRTVNSYGLFAVMTTERREIIVEGSNDRVTWWPYEFKYKPGGVNRRPGFIEPFQPRLDWQMWFAALGDSRQNPWFEQFCSRLLQGSPEVLALLATNSFPNKPPRFIRAQFYDYHFTDAAERRATGAWWKREFIGEYLPPVSLHE
ncbi:MAG TPA: lipase maturation factor family protein [Verrucomicrobiae bacterium]|nr:lipase maturation factor family protein [Verrucomicrobiae bacterium]